MIQIVLEPASPDGTGDEWRLDPDAQEDPNNFENLKCSYAGAAQAPLEPGPAALTIDVEPNVDEYEANAQRFIEVPVSGECAANEYEGPRPLQGRVAVPDWIATGPQRGSIREGLRGSSAIEPWGDPISSDGSVGWEMTAAG